MRRYLSNPVIFWPALIVLFALMWALIILPAVALAADGAPRDPNTFVLPTDQLWALLAGGLVPLVTYVINKYAPYTDDKAKAVVHLIAGAIAGGLAQAITAGNIGFNNTTLQFVVTSIIATISVQSWWKKSGIGPALGQGQNVQDEPHR